jgi:DNA-directed RNA polymerase subunit RPC12/RpoP
MGLPERIKKRLAPQGSQARSGEKKESAPAKRVGKKASGPIQRHADTPGLPVFQSPPLPNDHRAILVACAKTRRASWAMLKEKNPRSSAKGYRWAFQRNITAIPASKTGSPAHGGGSTASGPAEQPELALDDIDLTGFSCGICGAGSSTLEGTDLIRCGSCQTMQCVPQALYKCPGCGARIDTSSVYAMQSLHASQGNDKTPGAAGRKTPSNPQVGGPGSGSARRAIGG